MLGFLERTAVAAGLRHVFALSTHTMQWFMERGFTQVPLEALPERRIAIFNHERNSKDTHRGLKPWTSHKLSAHPCLPHALRSLAVL